MPGKNKESKYKIISMMQRYIEGGNLISIGQSNLYSSKKGHVHETYLEMCTTEL